jgi:uncharacterized protein YndB with AHSA1/START domain
MSQTTDNEVRVETLVDAPVERAFAVFTEQCDAWWPRSYRLSESERNDVVIEPRAGGRWYEVTEDGGTCDWGQVRSVDAPNTIELSWQIAVDWSPDPDPERASTVNVRFTPDGDGRARVTLLHTDFERHGEGWESMRDGVGGDGGWPGIIDAFAMVAATDS